MLEQRTLYQIEVYGRVDVEWLQSFDSSAAIDVDATTPDDITVLKVHADQSGMVGLVRRLHALGITIVQFHIVSDTSEYPASND